jgi:hypothetical protein
MYELSSIGKEMKYLRGFFVVMGAGVSIAWSTALCAQMATTNGCCLKLALTNDIAYFSIHDLTTNASGPIDLFLKTNLADPEGWTWLYRYASGQTNVAISNLPPTLCLFMLGVTNAIRPGFDGGFLPPEDDDPSTNASLPFAMKYFGAVYSNIWVNNNGNVTFDNPQSAYTPSALNTIKARIIAPFWADVDTRNAATEVVKCGTNVVNGRVAFGVDWINVGYYAMHADKQLSCQLVIIDRSDIDLGDFDMEFNYFKIQWEWGDVSVNNPPRAGYSDGVIDYELPGSGVGGAFQDTNSVTGLIYHNLNSPVPGRYVFSFRNGLPLP